MAVRVTLCGINFSPETSGIAPYTTSLASHLSAKHKVTMITGVPHYPAWKRRTKSPLLRNVVTRRQNLSIVRVNHFVPTRQDALRRLAYEVTWATRALPAMIKSRPDVLIAVVPPLFGALAVQVAARILKIPYGLIVQDIMSAAAAQSGVAGGSRVTHATRVVERYVLTRASGVVTIHDRLAVALGEIAGARLRPTIIPNWTHTLGTEPVSDQTKQAYRMRQGWGGKCVVLHTGNMGIKQNLGHVLEAAGLAEARGLPFHFVFVGDGSQRHSLEAQAQAFPNAQVLDPVPEGEYSTLLRSADILLLNEGPGVTDMSLPSKLTSYFAAGVAVLASVNTSGATASYVRSSSSALIVDAADSEALVNGADELRRNVKLRSELIAAAQKFAENSLQSVSALEAYDEWLETIISGK